ncbi:MAG: hypothetical protein AAF432_03920 [Planctomycetota bacterium]
MNDEVNAGTPDDPQAPSETVPASPQPPGVPAMPSSPPVVQGVVARPHQSTWPTVVGICLLVYGSLNALGGFCGIVGTFFVGALGDISAGQPGAPDMTVADMMPASPIVMAVMSLVMGSIAGLLIVSSTGLLRRRSWCLKALMVYAVAKIVVGGSWTIYQGFKQVSMINEMVDAQAGQGGAPPQAFMSSITALSIGFGFLYQVAVPVFVLIWFMRTKIRDEVMGWD